MKLLKLALATLLVGSFGAAHSAGVLTHDYQLNGTLTDAFAGPSLVAAGGTLGPNDYTFGANQGLSLSNGLVSNGNYSIEMRFSFYNLNGYNKILDFKNLSSDNGFYDLNSALNFYPVVTGGPAFNTGTMADVILTRDGASNTLTGYVNGVLQWSFMDVGSLAVFDQPNDIVQFFKDDFATGQREASSGVVDFIRIYDGALNANEICIGTNGCNNVPEPGTLALFGAIALAAGLRRRR